MPPGSARGPATSAQLLRWIDEEAARFLATVDRWWESDFNADSALPGVTTGHVVTHVARGADDYADEIYKARTGASYPYDSDRRFPEGPGSLRPGAVLIEDVVVAIERLKVELHELGPTGLDRDPTVNRVPREFLVEVALHHVDLGGSLRELDSGLIDELLAAAVEHAADQPTWPKLAINDDGAALSLEVGVDQNRTLVRGAPPDLLLWLTGRPFPEAPGVTGIPQLPVLPTWRCPRSLVTAGHEPVATRP